LIASPQEDGERKKWLRFIKENRLEAVNAHGPVHHRSAFRFKPGEWADDLMLKEHAALLESNTPDTVLVPDWRLYDALHDRDSLETQVPLFSDKVSYSPHRLRGGQKLTVRCRL
jgi:hypothetical protein